MSDHPDPDGLRTTDRAPHTTTSLRQRLVEAAQRDDANAIYDTGIDAYTDDPDLGEHLDRALALATELNHPRALHALLELGADPLATRVARALTPDADIEVLELLIKAARMCPNDRPQPGACNDPDALEDTLDPHDTTLFLFEMCTEHRPPTRRHATVRLVLASGLDPNTLDPYDGVLPAPVVSFGEPSPDDDPPGEDEEAPELFGPATLASSFVASDGTALHQLTAIGDLDGMHLLLEAGANPNARDASGGAPLHVATRATPSDPRRVRTLLAARADRDARDRYHRTPLHVATQRGNVRVTLELAHAGADLNGKDHRGRTPLMLALAHPHDDARTLVTALARKGADINARDNEGRTALILAAQAGRGDLVDLLLAYGADRHARDHTDTDAVTYLLTADPRD